MGHDGVSSFWPEMGILLGWKGNVNLWGTAAGLALRSGVSLLGYLINVCNY